MLSDLLVLDLTQYLPGPYATQLLADLGARVIKIEPPRGDPVRHLPPHDPEGVSPSYRALNRGKESLAVDLKRPEGRDLVLALVERADALLEGFRPGVMERLGLGAAVCQAKNPRLVYASISGYGQTGPYRDKAGHDLDYQAYAGALTLTGDDAGALVTPGLQSADLLGSLAALAGVLAALLERARTGRARRVDASLHDALVSAQGLHIAAHRAGLKAAPRAMPLNGGIPCYGVYRTRDGRAVALGALEPKFWAAFCELVDREEWVARQFDPGLRPDVAALFATRERDEWRVILENAEVCLAPALDYDELLDDPHARARGLVGTSGTAPPVRFEPPVPGADPDRPAALARRPGEHAAALLEELLGLPAARVDELRAAGVLG